MQHVVNNKERKEGFGSLFSPMYDYLFAFIQPNEILIFMEKLKSFRCLRVIEMHNDKIYNDIYVRIRYNKKLSQYGIEDFFGDWDIEYEPS